MWNRVDIIFLARSSYAVRVNSKIYHTFSSDFGCRTLRDVEVTLKNVLSWSINCDPQLLKLPQDRTEPPKTIATSQPEPAVTSLPKNSPGEGTLCLSVMGGTCGCRSCCRKCCGFATGNQTCSVWVMDSDQRANIFIAPTENLMGPVFINVAEIHFSLDYICLYVLCN